MSNSFEITDDDLAAVLKRMGKYLSDEQFYELYEALDFGQIEKKALSNGQDSDKKLELVYAEIERQARQWLAFNNQ